MTNNVKKLDYLCLQYIGYTHKLPMPIRATAYYQILNADEIIESTTEPLLQVNKKEVYEAAAIDFPLINKNGFKLTVSEMFQTQDKGIKIQGCCNFTIDLSTMNQSLHKSEKFFIEIDDCHSFSIENLDVIGGRNVIAITGSKDFLITNCNIKNAEGYAIIIHNSKEFKVTQCLLENNLAAGIMVVGESRNGLISVCQVRGSTGFFNWDAGIHMFATSQNVSLDDIPEKCHESLCIEKKDCRPYNIVIEHCLLSDNRAQGIYLEGVVNCLFQYNQLINNNKEGICFDWGSSHNIFRNNIVMGNGERKKLSVEEIAADFIEDYPTLEDGTSSMKLPGISVDNGCMNLIVENKINYNFGGGIKFIRTGLLNVIDKNDIFFNELGANKHMSYFSGITALGMGAINNEFDKNKAQLLNFFPSQLNIYSRNIIKGHEFSLYSDKLSTMNCSIDKKYFFKPNYMNNINIIFHKLHFLINCFVRRWSLTHLLTRKSITY